MVLTGKGNTSHSDECWNGISIIVPVNASGILHHHTSNKDQDRSSSPTGDIRENRSEENGKEEPEGNGDGGNTSFTSFGDTRCGFDERSTS